MSYFFSAIVLVSTKPAQHSVHPTGGFLAAKKGVNYAQTIPVKPASPHPVHQRVTQTVSPFF
jgi:hypothetical protein